jgi:hypothetical protein
MHSYPPVQLIHDNNKVKQKINKDGVCWLSPHRGKGKRTSLKLP